MKKHCIGCVVTGVLFGIFLAVSVAWLAVESRKSAAPEPCPKPCYRWNPGDASACGGSGKFERVR